MNTSKPASIVSFIIFVMLLMGACGDLTQRQRGNETAMSALTFTPVPQSPTVVPMASPIPTSASSKTYALDSIRMAYIVDGDLYVQDGSHLATQLTHSKEDLSPLLSNDGENIVFYRGKINDANSIYSIKADGGQEQEIIKNDWLNDLGVGTKAGHLAFVPGTHQLFFNTYLCPEELSMGCTTGLFLVDTDMAEITEVLPPAASGYLPFGGGAPWHGSFRVSPDGKFLAVAKLGSIDIFSIDGSVVYKNIMTYTRSTPIELFPRVFWLPDSNGLIVALPAEINYGGGSSMTPRYTVWRYDLDSKTANQIPLDPSPMWIYMECSDVMYISPDGNWTIFNRLEDNTQIYAGNLTNGDTQSYEVGIDCSPVYWSADSKYFVYGRMRGTFLGAIDGTLTPINGNFLGWIDSTHFMYSHFPNQGEILIGEIQNEEIATYQSGISLQAGYFPYSFAFVIPN